VDCESQLENIPTEVLERRESIPVPVVDRVPTFNRVLSLELQSSVCDIYQKSRASICCPVEPVSGTPRKRRLSIIEGNLVEQRFYDESSYYEHCANGIQNNNIPLHSHDSSENIYRGSLPNGDIPPHLSNGFYSQISQINVDKKISPESNYQPNVYSRNITLVSGDPADSSSYYQSEEQNYYFVDNILQDVYKQQQPNSSSYYRMEPQQKDKSSSQNINVYDSGYASDDFNHNPFDNKKNYPVYHQDFVPNYSLPSLGTVMETHMNNIANENSNKDNFLRAVSSSTALVASFPVLKFSFFTLYYFQFLESM